MKPISFFIIEDNDQDRMLIERVITSTFPKAEIRRAIRLSEGLQKLAEKSADLLILDLNLPDSIGYETYRQIQRTFPDLPVFILSVFGDSHLSVKAICEGAADFLSKEYLHDSTLVGQSIQKALNRTRTLTQLKEAKNKLGGILNSSSDGIVMTDLQGHTLFYNSTAQNLLGSTSLTVGDIFYIKPTFEDEQTFHSNPESNDKTLTLSVSTNPCEWGNRSAYCFTIRDVTHQQVMIDALIASRTKADQSNEAKGTFLANMSHEIRTPLNGIMGSASLLMDTPLNREQSDYVRTIYQSSEFLLALINDLLDLSKIEAGKFSVEQTYFNLSELIKSCQEQFPLKQNGYQVHFSVRQQKSLPDILQGDPWRLRQILTNLLGNAFKFTHSGTITLTVEKDDSFVPSKPEETRIVFTVADTGVGISPEVVPQLFTPFYQGGSEVAKQYGGTGLGLAISKRLTSLMGGRLTVSSRLGTGTEFKLYLPFNFAEAHLSAQPQKALSEIRSGERLPNQMFYQHRPLILVAEDHPINQKLVVKMLEVLGCRVICANSGREAIERAAHTAVDLILMDCQMPEMSGMEAALELRKLPQYERTPIIAMTAMVYPNDIDKCLQNGMNEVLKKPFKKVELENILLKWLGVEYCPLGDSPQLPIVDQETIEGWKKLAPSDSDNFEHELLELFFTTSRDFLEKAELATVQLDYETLLHLLHRFRGSAGHLGAKRLAKYLETSEKWISDRHVLIPNMLATVRSEINSLEQYFKFQPEQDSPFH